MTGNVGGTGNRYLGFKMLPAPGVPQEQTLLLLGSASSKMENAQKTHMQQLLSKSKPNSQPVMADQLLQLLTLYELEWAIRNMNPNKAAGVDGIGAEIWQAQTVETAMRLFPLLLK